MTMRMLDIRFKIVIVRRAMNCHSEPLLHFEPSV